MSWAMEDRSQGADWQRQKAGDTRRWVAGGVAERQQGERRNDRRFNFVSHYYKNQFYKLSKVISHAANANRMHPKICENQTACKNKFCERKLKMEKTRPNPSPPPL